MKDSNNTIGVGAFGPEPEHDARLGALLREAVGPTPSVNWESLANRISASVAAHRSAPWWSYATRWERRALTMALSAGIAATFALLSTSESAQATQPTAAAEAVTAVISGTPAEDAALSFAHYVTGSSDFSVGIPE